MSPPHKPQLRFLARVSVLFAAALALWWFAMRGPLLEWVRLSTAVLLDAAGGFRTDTAVVIQPAGVWMIQAPVPSPSAGKNLGAGGVRFRSLKLQVPQWVPTVQTVSLPFFWALILAAPRPRGWWRPLAIGTLVLLAIPSLSLLVYAAHVVQRNVYPDAGGGIGWLLDFADYLCGTVLPYIAPLLLAVALNRQLRSMIVGAEEPAPLR
jgi:hypothetical protein